MKEDPDEEYEVEAIKDSKTDKKSGELFLVKWKGYADKHSTWEPKENLSHAADLLQDFEDTREEREKETEEKKAAPTAKKTAKTKAKAATKPKTKKVAPAKKAAAAKKAAPAKPTSTSRSRGGRPRRN